MKILLKDAAFIAAIAIANKCLQSKDKSFVRRDMDEESLNRQLTIVSLVYHALGLFYNE